MSQAELAVLSGMAPATLNRIEQGKANPNVKTLEKLASTLGVGVADFFPKAQAAPRPEEKNAAGRRTAFFPEAMLDAADRLVRLISEPGAHLRKRRGISAAASAIGDAIEEHVEQVGWDSLPNEERREILGVMERLTEVVERDARRTGDEVREMEAELRRKQIRKWTTQLSA